METVLIFANPIAGRGRAAKMADSLAAHLGARGYAVRILLERPQDLDPNSMSGPARAVVVIGGDGTLRAVAQQLELLAEPPPLLTVPMGTANLMARHLGVTWGRDRFETQVGDAIARRRIRQIDAGRVNGELFFLMIGIGFDAHVVHELARVRRGPIRYTSYLLPAALAIGGYHFAQLQVFADGREVFSPQPAIAFVGNVPEYGTGFSVLPHARTDDGLLDLCVLPCASRMDLVRWFLLAAAGEHTEAEGAFYLRARHVRVESPDEVPIQVDGDSAGHTPVQIDLLPRKVAFIVP